MFGTVWLIDAALEELEKSETAEADNEPLRLLATARAQVYAILALAASNGNS